MKDKYVRSKQRGFSLVTYLPENSNFGIGVTDIARQFVFKDNLSLLFHFLP